MNKEHNQEHHSICTDFDDPDDLKNKITMHIESIDKTVDILVNNSGDRGGPLIEAEEDEFRIAFERLLICNHIMVKQFS